MKIFMFLLFAHYMGDFALQSNWLAISKTKFSYAQFAHAMIWSACICVALEYFGMFTLFKAGFLIAGHYTIDRCKDAGKFGLVVDQLLHVLQLYLVFSAE
jgi:hypothetical protein